MLAFGMNGEPLPVEHGFPVRMVIPGLYGYVSACKWLTGIEATTFDAYDAYWVERDWAAEGPIKVASRIDTPAPLRDVPAGAVVDRRGRLGAGRRASSGSRSGWTTGTGAEAELSPEVDADLWRQWVPARTTWPAGRHPITVRATDADGEAQVEEQAPHRSRPARPAGTPSEVVTA